MHCESKLYFINNRCSAATLERTMNCKIIDTSQLLVANPVIFHVISLIGSMCMYV